MTLTQTEQVQQDTSAETRSNLKDRQKQIEDYFATFLTIDQVRWNALLQEYESITIALESL